MKRYAVLFRNCTLTGCTFKWKIHIQLWNCVKITLSIHCECKRKHFHLKTCWNIYSISLFSFSTFFQDCSWFFHDNQIKVLIETSIFINNIWAFFQKIPFSNKKDICLFWSIRTAEKCNKVCLGFWVFEYLIFLSAYFNPLNPRTSPLINTHTHTQNRHTHTHTLSL